eukprot:GDKJ01021087.1.p1 GENE.GDKJ01021087.1~~GDKJ01021087.1.p1  ORF type:complete len:379 (-),score=88.25 GDKJ01021087.1:986-2122(-)
MSSPIKRKAEGLVDSTAKRLKVDDLSEELKDWFTYYLECGYDEETALETISSQQVVASENQITTEQKSSKLTDRELTRIREDFATARNYAELQKLISEYSSLMKDDLSLCAKAIRRYSIIKCRHPDELPWAEFGGNLADVVNDKFVEGLRSCMDYFVESLKNQSTVMSSKKMTSEKVEEEKKETQSVYVSCNAVCDFGWGLSKMNIRCFSLYKTLVTSLHDEKGRHGRFSAVPLADFLWAFGRQIDMELMSRQSEENLDGPTLLQEDGRAAITFLMDEMVGNVDMSALEVSDLKNLMHGVSKIGIVHADLLRSVAEEVVLKNKECAEKDFALLGSYFMRFNMNLGTLIAALKEAKNPKRRQHPTTDGMEALKPQPIPR